MMGSKLVKFHFSLLFCSTRGIVLLCSRNSFLIKSSFRSADNMVPKRITSKIVTPVIQEISILVLMLRIMYVHVLHILSYIDFFYHFIINSIVYGIELAKKFVRSINKTRTHTIKMIIGLIFIGLDC